MSNLFNKHLAHSNMSHHTKTRGTGQTDRQNMSNLFNKNLAHSNTAYIHRILPKMALPDQNSKNDRILPKIASAVNFKRRSSTFNRETPGDRTSKQTSRQASKQDSGPQTPADSTFNDSVRVPSLKVPPSLNES